MTSFIGPDIAQTVYKPVVIVEDSKKFEDGIVFKTNGSNGSNEFTGDDLVTVYAYIRDYLKSKGLDPDVEAAANRFLDQSYITH